MTDPTDTGWRACPACNGLARTSYAPERCPGCGAPNRVATPEEIETRAVIVSIPGVLGVRGHRSADRRRP